MRAFISYSHKDNVALERLHTHLAILRREGKIVSWFDREILAGDELDREVERNLAQADLFLALVSPDFLASNYCYEREMAEAISRHEAGTMRVVPIVVEPCDWKTTPLQKFKALPRDGKPVSEWTNTNTAYLDVVTELRRLADAPRAMGTPPSPAIGPERQGARRYRVKRDFDEIDRSEFRIEAFKVISAYFEKAVAELNGIDGLRASYAVMEPTRFTCTVLNKSRQRGVAHLTVFTASRGLGDLAFNNEEGGATNTANGWFSLESDEYDLFFRGGAFSSNRDQKLDGHQVAEQLWASLLERAGVTVNG